jgi:hypothetical protein
VRAVVNRAVGADCQSARRLPTCPTSGQSGRERRILKPRPLCIGARAELPNRNSVTLPPKPVIISEISPGVSQNSWLSLGIQSEVMGVFMSECCFASVPQAQEDLVERVGCKSGPSRTWPYRTGAGAIPVDVIS